MSTQRQDRRGTTAQHASFTGAVGEITIDTDLDEPRVHDGSRAGGFNIPNFSSLQKRLYSYDASPGGTATAITCSTQVDAIALTAGLEVTLKMASSATGASTLTWGSLTTKNIKKYSGGTKVDIEADDWVTSQEITFWYDGTDWVAQLGGGGGRSIIATASPASVSTLDFQDIFTPGNYYEIVGSNIQGSSDGANFGFRVSDDAGSTYETTKYWYAQGGYRSGGTTHNIGSSSNTYIILLGNLGIANERGNIKLSFAIPDDGFDFQEFNWDAGYFANSGDFLSVSGAAVYGSAPTGSDKVDSIRFLFSSGTIEDGEFTVYQEPLQ